MDKKLKKLKEKAMTKKALKEYYKKDRGEAMPRPAVFKDKRYQEKYKISYTTE